MADTTECKQDADCASKLACFSGWCKNPCIETHPCGTNAQCRVVDTLPLRTMSCHCSPGFVGDADVQCVQGRQISACFNPFKCLPSHCGIDVIELILTIYVMGFVLCFQVLFIGLTTYIFPFQLPYPIYFISNTPYYIVYSIYIMPIYNISGIPS